MRLDAGVCIGICQKEFAFDCRGARAKCWPLTGLRHVPEVLGWRSAFVSGRRPRAGAGGVGNAQQALSSCTRQAGLLPWCTPRLCFHCSRA